MPTCELMCRGIVIRFSEVYKKPTDCLTLYHLPKKYMSLLGGACYSETQSIFKER